MVILLLVISNSYSDEIQALKTIENETIKLSKTINHKKIGLYFSLRGDVTFGFWLYTIIKI